MRQKPRGKDSGESFKDPAVVLVVLFIFRDGCAACEVSHHTSDEAKKPSEVDARRTLRQLLIKRFNKPELKDLSFDLGVDYEDLSGSSKKDKARELLAYLDRRGRLPELVKVGREERTDISWPCL